MVQHYAGVHPVAVALWALDHPVVLTKMLQRFGEVRQACCACRQVLLAAAFATYVGLRMVAVSSVAEVA
jgi:hypothetical protein